MSVEKAFEINQQSSKRKEMTEELEDIQRDMVELNQVLGLIKVCSVKEAIVSDYRNVGQKIAAGAAVIRDSVISAKFRGGRENMAEVEL